MPRAEATREQEPVGVPQLARQPRPGEIGGLRVHLHVERGGRELRKQIVEIRVVVVRASEIGGADEERLIGLRQLPQSVDYLLCVARLETIPDGKPALAGGDAIRGKRLRGDDGSQLGRTGGDHDQHRDGAEHQRGNRCDERHAPPLSSIAVEATPQSRDERGKQCDGTIANGTMWMPSRRDRAVGSSAAEKSPLASRVRAPRSPRSRHARAAPTMTSTTATRIAGVSTIPGKTLGGGKGRRRPGSVACSWRTSRSRPSQPTSTRTGRTRQRPLRTPRAHAFARAMTAWATAPSLE